jgi:hypothetical protein
VQPIFITVDPERESTVGNQQAEAIQLSTGIRIYILPVCGNLNFEVFHSANIFPSLSDCKQYFCSDSRTEHFDLIFVIRVDEKTPFILVMAVALPQPAHADQVSWK